MPEASRDLVLGQVEAALPPTGIDKVKVRAVLLAAMKLGYNPAELYVEAQQNRPPQFERPPYLWKVLPAEVLAHLEKQGQLEDQAGAVFHPPRSPNRQPVLPPPSPAASAIVSEATS